MLCWKGPLVTSCYWLPSLASHAFFNYFIGCYKGLSKSVDLRNKQWIITVIITKVGNKRYKKLEIPRLGPTIKNTLKNSLYSCQNFRLLKLKTNISDCAQLKQFKISRLLCNRLAEHSINSQGEKLKMNKKSCSSKSGFGDLR